MSQLHLIVLLQVTSLALGPDRAYTGSVDDVIRVWDLRKEDSFIYEVSDSVECDVPPVLPSNILSFCFYFPAERTHRVHFWNCSKSSWDTSTFQCGRFYGMCNAAVPPLTHLHSLSNLTNQQLCSFVSGMLDRMRKETDASKCLKV